VTLSAQYGPDETWPRHQKPFWNEALDDARSTGWTLKYVDASHRFGEVFCPGGEDGTRHSFMVDKTAVGGETKSREARKAIRNCQHGSAASGSKVRIRQAECRRLLDEAEHLIDLADARLTLAEAEQAAWADIERIETQIETAAANLAEILREELDATLQAIEDAGDSPDPEAIEENLDDAMAAVVGSENVATALKIRRPRLAQPLLDGAQAARGRIAELRARLMALP
jgi:hypothetical protein